MVSADGGQGGTGGCCGDGGGGAGGRIAYEFVKLTAEGSPTVAGGTSGTSGTFGFGHRSPQVAGAPGVITLMKAAVPTTGGATSVKRSTARVHGKIKGDGQRATYQFQYGTSKTYGKRLPGSAASAGSGTSTKSVSASLKRLKAGRNYHYRIVVHSLGFTLFGADRTFRTKKAAVTPPPKFTG